SGVCAGATTTGAYQQAVRAATAFLSRSQASWIGSMKRQMGAYARALEFERARWLRDRIIILERALEKQIVERDVDYDQDVIYFGPRDGLTMQVRRGCVLALVPFRLPPDEGRVAYLTAQYAGASPRELIVNGVPEPDRLSVSLSQANHARVRVIRPQRGVRRALLALCQHNYHYRQRHMLVEA
ncbi:MAG: hypothetical protein R3300_10825, partial [Candidatus Promineifilaceae bacterium]|nr:hypothetical protein [Candidatus Promineifilaceae bacterium]